MGTADRVPGRGFRAHPGRCAAPPPVGRISPLRGSPKAFESQPFKRGGWPPRHPVRSALGRRPSRGGDFRTGRGVYTRLLVDDGDVRQHNFLMELVANPAGLRAIHPAD